MIFGTVASTGHNYSISLMHWRAIATLKQQRKYDQAIQYASPSRSKTASIYKTPNTVNSIEGRDTGREEGREGG